MIVALSFWLVSACVDTETNDLGTGFDYYLGEFLQNHLEDNHAMHRLIEEGLATSLFDSNDKQIFYKKIQCLQDAYQERPDLSRRFKRLDGRMQREFQARLEAAKERRWIATAIGVGAGALIGIPIGYALKSRLGAQALWISIPATALAGGATGFLLGDLLYVPAFSYQPQFSEREFDRELDAIDHLIEESLP